jgi:glycosyltransferase involved in cell wall biosynthesis
LTKRFIINPPLKYGMRIGMVSKFPEEKDGIAIYTENLCDAMDEKVVRIGDLNSTRADYRINFKSLLLGKKLAEIARREKLDVLHIQYIAAGQYFGKYTLNMPVILALKQKVPIVITLHEVQYNCSGLRQKVLCVIERQIVSKADAIIAHTPMQAEFISKKYKTNARCVYMGVKDLKKFAMRGKKLLFFGMINEGKGIEYLIEAMKLLPDFTLTVAGKSINEKYSEKLKQLAAGRKNVKMIIGWVSEQQKKKILSDASIMVLPYVWAPYQSAVATDAITNGMPIIVTKVGGSWELVQKFCAGEVIEPRNPEQIARAAKKINSDYGTYTRGISEYRKSANWKRVAAETIKMYGKILQGSK